MASPSLPASICADLIGKPFLDGGRGPSAYDCWGVLQAVLHRLGKTPTDFPSNPDLLRYAIADEWQPLEAHQVQPGDGVLLRSADPRWQWHIGVIFDGCHMLHAREGVGVCIERFDSLTYQRRIVGFYRFRGRPE